LLSLMEIRATSFPERKLLLKWAGACALGETLGFGVAGLGAGLLLVLDLLEPENLTEKFLAWGLIVLFGAGEGLMLGGFQSRVLRKLYPRLNVPRWVQATALMAALGWALGMIPSLFFYSDAPAEQTGYTPPLGFILLIYASAGTVVGLFQWPVLRQAAHRAGWWVAANAMAWIPGLWILFEAASRGATSSLAPVAPFGFLAVSTLGGLLAGASIGLVTWPFFCFMPPKPLF